MDGGLILETAGMAVFSLFLTLWGFVQWRRQAAAATVLFGLGALIGIWTGVLAGTAQDRGSRWRWLFASLPAVILATHAAFLYLVRSRLVPQRSDENREKTKRILAVSKEQRSFDSLVDAGERYFTLEALLLRYIVPAFFVFALPLCASNAIVKWMTFMADARCPGDAGAAGLCQMLAVAVHGAHPTVVAEEVVNLPASVMFGAACGLAGAYVYVLLYLGRRAFRFDITPGAATWSAVTLAIGPMFAGFLGPYVIPRGAPDVTDLQRASVLFFAGFSPRIVVTFLGELVQRFFSSSSAANAMPSRTIPLNQVKGITYESAERLSEEGIEDANQLAMADPYRILRNTSFDKRQLLRWLDCAILMTKLPESYPALERRGIAGAMDLVWYVLDDARKDDLKTLAADAKMDATGLYDVALRLADDPQFQLVRVLYHLEGDGSS